MEGQELISLYKLRRRYTGLAQQVAKSVQKYLESELNRKKQELQFLVQQRTAEIQHQAKATARAVKQTQKSISDFLS